MNSIRRGQRRAVDVDGGLVATGYLPGREGSYPAVVTPARAGVDLAGWGTEHRAEAEALLAQHGAVLFRGFDVVGPDAFARSAGAFVDSLFGDYGDLPREADGDRVFSSTPYPADLEIHFHNEGSHLSRWPMRIFFGCVIAAETGGETPLIDCRRLLDHLGPQVVADFDAKRLTYVRNFSRSVDVSWQDFFGTGDRDEVERRCAASGTRTEWLGDGVLRIKQDAAAVRRHPASGERVFFNQVLLHHPAALPADTRAAMNELYDDEDSFPRNVTYGDGSRIPDSVIDHLQERYAEVQYGYRWEVGDMVMLDNMLVSHSRAPFTGARKIIVAMAHLQGASA